MEKIGAVNVADISISIVSHAQINLIVSLLQDIEDNCKSSSLELILTLNLDETLPFQTDAYSYPIKVIRNVNPMGFAANHNQAFTHATGRYFCVLNPDIRFSSDPFMGLTACFENTAIGMAAPLVLGNDGGIEDSARRFPSPLKILCKIFGKCKGSDYVIGDKPICPDWAAGMFMLFPRDIFERLRGFDQRYFLYYEDVDICARLRLLGYGVILCPQSRVTHHAQRSSHRNFRYFRWHLRSMLRFFCSRVFWKIQCHKLI